ncbi:hypothetical protein Bca4012_065658 [Brassica carinata]|uniref:Uncharacterized protein n=1 Tax=Brassica carinata TaxID=52824 RepID=A0A8X8AYX6_BRACI|nr:hypothetical protein Bca52824_017969 [Brassica carinata]
MAVDPEYLDPSSHDDENEEEPRRRSFVVEHSLVSTNRFGYSAECSGVLVLAKAWKEKSSREFIKVRSGLATEG